MQWRDYFESIRESVVELASIERRIEEARAATEPKGQRFGSIGRGGSSDPTAASDRVIELERERDRAAAKLAPRLDAATKVLYGTVAKERGSVDADILCGYYLMGMGWRQVAEEVARRDVAYPRQWCYMRAQRTLEWMDGHMGH
jgi:hypothetical protein